MTYVVNVTQGGGEYSSDVTMINVKDFFQTNHNTVIVNGAEIVFEYETINKVSRFTEDE